ncbi:MAG TPA: LysM peptidoglycan-binding domain-containing protein [Candidatus Aphodocola excrementigallinarum]|uniref:LysM peptidoglycan-binding domain-containing protein n=1 Tax=Candidatus Aphodocola excrementigallinarum TaxID=2840670 RepID=A0A9D1LHQ8_9FIRM|nr:LysM peptidoglycan-binding domain-containing protein [Candidatus Aphodocola excrementigallinarum]
MVIVDAGHGGTDPGASSGDIIEKEYTLKISNYMYNRFKELGIPTFITRTTDTTLNPTDRINTITPYVTSSDDIVISNHLNAGGGDGAEVVYALRNDDTLAKSILDNIEATGQNIRKWYQRKLPSNSSKDYYYIIRNTSPAESVLVEYAFLDSTKDDRNQIKNDWEKWAEAVVKAVAEYKGYNYVAPGGNTVNDTYTVQKGDSLWSIAKRFNVGVDEIKSANNLTSNLINVGQKLVIPGAAPSDQTNVTYVVQKGDSLWSIANANNTTVDEIANLNDLDTNTIYVGQILQIPNSGDLQENPSSTSDTVYVVKSGDTLYSIALRYDTTPNAIINKNNLTSSVLTIGQQLIIPSDPESTGEDDITTNNTYVVQNGDSLYSISRMYGISVDDIKNANNLTSNILTIGQVLTIPTDEVSSNTSNLYVVQKGDSLWSIANRFGVSINQIRMMNNLNSDILNIGQTLIIP